MLRPHALLTVARMQNMALTKLTFEKPVRKSTSVFTSFKIEVVDLCIVIATISVEPFPALANHLAVAPPFSLRSKDYFARAHDFSEYLASASIGTLNFMSHMASAIRGPYFLLGAMHTNSSCTWMAIRTCGSRSRT